MHVRIQELEEERAASYDNLIKLQQQAKPLNEAIQGIDREINERRMEHTNAVRDARNAGTVQTAAEVAALATSEQAVEEAKEVVRLVSAEDGAGKLHETIVRYTEIAKALGPEGVRAKMLESGLKKLNGGLATIAKESGLATHCSC